MNNAEYLKRYMSKEESIVKKKKKVKLPKSNIIDDDVDINKFNVVKSGTNIEGYDDLPIQVVDFLEQEKNARLNFTAKNWMNYDETNDVKIEAPDPTQEPSAGFAFKGLSIKQEPLSPDQSDRRILTDSTAKMRSIKSRRRHGSLSDASPQTNRCDSDASPPRKSTRRDSNTRPSGKSNDHNSDVSPPRRSRRCDSDTSPPRKSKTRHNRLSNGKLLKNNASNRDSSPDVFPPRRGGRTRPGTSAQDENDSDVSPPRKDGSSRKQHAAIKQTSSLSPTKGRGRHDSGSSDDERSDDSNIRQEHEVIYRDKTKSMKVLEEEKRNKEEQEKLIKAKYSEWSSGLKQKEMWKESKSNMTKEVEKPMARYADDEDLNKQLKNVERNADPMLGYMRQKKAKEASKSGNVLPAYSGPEPPPNRFDIKPGYRWDGVNRSNGFEKKMFDTQNHRKADRQEAYKWSTEDM